MVAELLPEQAGKVFSCLALPPKAAQLVSAAAAARQASYAFDASTHKPPARYAADSARERPPGSGSSCTAVTSLSIACHAGTQCSLRLLAGHILHVHSKNSAEGAQPLLCMLIFACWVQHAGQEGGFAGLVGHFSSGARRAAHLGTAAISAASKRTALILCQLACLADEPSHASGCNFHQQACRCAWRCMTPVLIAAISGAWLDHMAQRAEFATAGLYCFEGSSVSSVSSGQQPPACTVVHHSHTGLQLSRLAGINRLLGWMKPQPQRARHAGAEMQARSFGMAFQPVFGDT